MFPNQVKMRCGARVIPCSEHDFKKYLFLFVPLLPKLFILLQLLFVISSIPASFNLGDDLLSNISSFFFPRSPAVPLNVRSQNDLLFNLPDPILRSVLVKIECRNRFLVLVLRRGGGEASAIFRNIMERPTYKVFPHLRHRLHVFFADLDNLDL